MIQNQHTRKAKGETRKGSGGNRNRTIRPPKADVEKSQRRKVSGKEKKATKREGETPHGNLPPTASVSTEDSAQKTG